MQEHTVERTPTIVNTTQARAWNGLEGWNWARYSASRPRDADLVEALLEAAPIQPTTLALDIGCGTGALTRRVAQIAASGWAVGIDLSASMIAESRRMASAAWIANAEFVIGDAQVHAFDASSFDVAVSHFGTMFFDDPVVAFTNIAAALRPGGRLLFACPAAMEDCSWYGVPLGALLGHPPTATDAPSAMFSLAEPATVQRILTASGFADISLTRLDRSLWFGADVGDAAWALTGSGPVRRLLELDPTLTEADARRAIGRAVAPYAGADGVRIPGSHWLVDATRRT
jgi:SAM-dependent methyltransferase